MDCIPTLVPFDQKDEEPQRSSSPSQQQMVQKDQLPAQNGSNMITFKLDFGRRQKSSFPFGGSDEKTNSSKKKKIVHREIERQRRQEMATLHTSLRSLIPVEHLKGKRSLSDNIHNAENYVKHLQDKIQGLSDKRDQLKMFSNSSSPILTQENLPSPMQDSVTVTPCGEGVEVVVNATLRQGLPLSRLLTVLVGEGLSIVSCISTKVNERLLQTIESKVSDGRSIDLPELQQKLTNLLIWPPKLDSESSDLQVCET